MPTMNPDPWSRPKAWRPLTSGEQSIDHSKQGENRGTLRVRNGVPGIGAFVTHEVVVPPISGQNDMESMQARAQERSAQVLAEIQRKLLAAEVVVMPVQQPTAE